MKEGKYSLAVWSEDTTPRRYIEGLPNIGKKRLLEIIKIRAGITEETDLDKYITDDGSYRIYVEQNKLVLEITPKIRFIEQELTNGDVVEFPDNELDDRYGVVQGGFGMHTYTHGSKIYGNFGSTPEKAVENYELDLNSGYTRRQSCRIVKHIDLKEIKKNSSTKGIGQHGTSFHMSVEIKFLFQLIHDEYQKTGKQTILGDSEYTPTYEEACKILNELSQKGYRYYPSCTDHNEEGRCNGHYMTKEQSEESNRRFKGDDK